MTDKDPIEKKEEAEIGRGSVHFASWLNSDDAFVGTEEDSLAENEPVSLKVPTALPDGETITRLEWIKESYALLEQFNPRELKTLMSLKRNTSPKAWTLREDLVVLSLAMSNREMAGVLKDRNKEAVKKRLQLLRSKGLSKRTRDPLAP